MASTAPQDNGGSLRKSIGLIELFTFWTCEPIRPAQAFQIGSAGGIIGKNPLKIGKRCWKAAEVHSGKLSPIYRIGNKPDRQDWFKESRSAQVRDFPLWTLPFEAGRSFRSSFGLSRCFGPLLTAAAAARSKRAQSSLSDFSLSTLSLDAVILAPFEAPSKIAPAMKYIQEFESETATLFRNLFALSLSHLGRQRGAVQRGSVRSASVREPRRRGCRPWRRRTRSDLPAI